MLAWYMLLSSARLSVWLSQVGVLPNGYKHTFTHTMSYYDSSGTLVFWRRRSRWNSTFQRTWLVCSTAFSNVKDFSRSQAITYTVNVMIARKRYKIESLLLQTTNRSLGRDVWPIEQRQFDSLRVTFRVVRLQQAFSNVSFLWAIQQLTRFRLIFASRGPSAIGEILVRPGDAPDLNSSQLSKGT